VASGRPLHFFWVELRQLVTEDPLVDIYDEDLNEPLFVDDDDDKVGTLKRPEKDAFLVKATIEVQDFESLRQVATGNAPDSNTKLYIHRRDLIRAGLLDAATGVVTLMVNDRVSRILDRFRRPAVSFGNLEIFVTEVRPAVLEHGLNFWQVDLDSRKQGEQL